MKNQKFNNFSPATASTSGVKTLHNILESTYKLKSLEIFDPFYEYTSRAATLFAGIYFQCSFGTNENNSKFKYVLIFANFTKKFLFLI